MIHVSLQFKISMWLFGFMSKIGQGDPLLAELCAILQGLSLCWQRGFRKVHCESDCAQAILFLQHGGVGANPLYLQKIVQCLDLLNRNWEVSLLVVPRDCNRVADKLVKLA